MPENTLPEAFISRLPTELRSNPEQGFAALLDAYSRQNQPPRTTRDYMKAAENDIDWKVYSTLDPKKDGEDLTRMAEIFAKENAPLSLFVRMADSLARREHAARYEDNVWFEANKTTIERMDTALKNVTAFGEDADGKPIPFRDAATPQLMAVAQHFLEKATPAPGNTDLPTGAATPTPGVATAPKTPAELTTLLSQALLGATDNSNPAQQAQYKEVLNGLAQATGGPGADDNITIPVDPQFASMTPPAPAAAQTAPNLSLIHI